MSDDSANLTEVSDSRERPLVDSAWAQFEALTGRRQAPPTNVRRGFAIPGYRVLREMHRGGQGVVYQAVQESTHRKVAIKVLKGGSLADATELARFDREVDILSRLKHRHIVAIHDRGLTAGGHAYYVMDYIPGRALDAYVAGAALSTRDLLKLFHTICQAVNVAHLRGVIHRDLKPSNIRIDEEHEPHILDFGLAKLTHDRRTAAGVMTITGQFVGSLPWSSPEQAEGRADLLDLRTDVYSLGVILYQLLTRSFPYPVTGRMNEVVQNIVQTIPARPSTLVGRLDHDVEVILLKCLAKDPERRYQSAGELASDIQRFLSGEPIEARPATSLYQLRQFARRNKALVISVIAIMVILAAATTVSVAFAFRATAARNQTRAVADFQAQILADIDPQSMGGMLRTDLLSKARDEQERIGGSAEDVDAHVTEIQKHIAGIDFTGLALNALDKIVFQKALVAIDKQFTDQPLIKARLLQTVASTQHGLGLLDAATGPQQQALAIFRFELGDENPDTLVSVAEMGLLIRAQGKLAEAQPYYEEVLATRSRTLGDDHPDTLSSLHNMGALLQARGSLTEAESLYRRVLDVRRRILGDEHPDTLTSIASLGYLFTAQGNWDQAEPYYREVLEKRRRVLGDEHPHTLFAINNMGALLQTQRKFDEAEVLYREGLEKRRRVLGDEHPDTLQSLNNLGNLLQALDRNAEAEPYYREALMQRRRVLGDQHPNTLNSMGNLGTLLQSDGRFEEAELLMREALDGRRRILGDEHPSTVVSIYCMGKLRQAQGKPTETVGLLAPAESAAQRAFAGDNAVRLGRYLTVLGRARVGTSEFAAAEANLTEAYAILNDAMGATVRDRAEVTNGLVELYEAWHASKRDNGYDSRAAEWRTTLRALRAATPTAPSN